MELESADITLIDQIVTRVRLLCKRNHIPVIKLNLDCNEFAVQRRGFVTGFVSMKRVQANSDVWYSKDLLPISKERKSCRANFGFGVLVVPTRDLP